MNKSNNKTYSSFEKTVINYIPVKPGLRILDLGCGTGETGVQLKEKFGAEVYGVSISKTECEIASKLIDNCYLYNLEDGLPQELNKKFDVVLLSHVLEHICYPENLLLQIKNVLQPDGIVVVALPNIMHYNSRFNLLRGNFEYAEKGIYDFTHFRWYTYNSTPKLFAKYGYKAVISDVTVSMPFGRLLNRIKNERVKELISALCKKISKGFFGWELVFVFKLNNPD
jgi:SAM-dependent methyltransferase